MRLLNYLFILPYFLLSVSVASDNLPSATATVEMSAKEQVLDGTIEAVQKATMSAQVSGRITEINFDVDDAVKKGDVILRIRNTEYKARVQNAKASLNEAEANLNDAKLEYTRVSGLYKDKIVSASVFDKTKAQLKSAEARVAASEARVTESNEQLSNTAIRAPYSGIVVERHVELGETLQPGMPVMTGFSLNKLRVAVDVPQSYINAIRSFNTAHLIPLAPMAQTASVKNLTIFPFANPKNHTFHVRANLKKDTKNLYPGMLVKIAFKVDETKRLLIPQSAVVYRGEVIAVYVINENNKISFRQIRLGHVFDNKVEVTAGLSENEKVAINPVKAGVLLKSQTESK